ncbi:hypothetical protein RL73_05685 [Liberibacter crescens]|nr:hypothetical protein RL73_05685 [Liberibacter crescens]
MYYILIVFGTLFLGGFLWFSILIMNMDIPEDPSANAIVVLTGAPQRIEKALELLTKKVGKRLLISGVHHSISKNQLQQKTHATKDFFECCVDIGYKALDTIGNAKEISDWVHKHNYQRVLVVTNNYHMLRSFLELRRVDTETEFIPYPVIIKDSKPENYVSKFKIIKTMFIEYTKTFLALLRIA